LFELLQTRKHIMANVALKSLTNAEVPSAPRPPDEPLLDMAVYGAGPNDSITDANGNAAVTHHAATISGTMIPYAARAGHLVAVDTSSSHANAKFFYVEAEPFCGLEIEDEFEFRLLFDRDALGPQRDLVVAARPREADAFLYQGAADAEVARLRLDQDHAQLPDCPEDPYRRPQARVHLGGPV
jgi:hypothetical protein